MRRYVGWLVLIALGVGLVLDFPRRSRLLTGSVCLLIGCMAAWFTALRASEIPSPDSGVSPDARDGHQIIIAETFEELSPAEAAALAGVLHDYRIQCEARCGDSSLLEPLDLKTATRLVAGHAGLQAGRVRELYYENWVHLRSNVAPMIRQRLREHPGVNRLVRYPEAY